ncbi:MAG: hypothetical protein ACRD2W_20580 [Acidimicrobiales bacterium]
MVDVIGWLVRDADPAIRALARADLLAETPGEDVASGPMVQALLDGDWPGLHPYSKWTGAHWRLISLVELGVPPDEPQLTRMVEHVLGWLADRERIARAPVIGGKTRRHASQEGNGLTACCRLGLSADRRVAVLAATLLESQWPDGGWNCDRHVETQHSSFHETLPALWGLYEFGKATGDAEATTAAARGAELLLGRRLFKRHHNGSVIHPSWIALHYPPYWHYDILQALLVLSRMGRAGDPRAADALDRLATLRLADGWWRSGGRWWNPPGSARYPEVVDWGRSGPNFMITLNALRVLRAAGRNVP